MTYHSEMRDTNNVVRERVNYDDHITYSQTQTGGTVPFINFLKSPLNVSVVLFQSAHSPPSTNTYRSKPNCDSKGLIHQIFLSFGRYEYCLNLDRFFYNFQVCFGLYCSYNLYRLMWKASGWKNCMLFFSFVSFTGLLLLDWLFIPTPDCHFVNY